MRFQAVCELAQAWCWWKVLESASTMNVGVAVVDSEAQVRTIEDPFPNVAKHPLGLEIHCRLAGRPERSFVCSRERDTENSISLFVRIGNRPDQDEFFDCLVKLARRKQFFRLVHDSVLAVRR